MPEKSEEFFYRAMDEIFLSRGKKYYLKKADVDKIDGVVSPLLCIPIIRYFHLAPV